MNKIMGYQIDEEVYDLGVYLVCGRRPTEEETKVAENLWTMIRRIKELSG